MSETITFEIGDLVINKPSFPVDDPTFHGFVYDIGRFPQDQVYVHWFGGLSEAPFRSIEKVHAIELVSKGTR